MLHIWNVMSTVTHIKKAAMHSHYMQSQVLSIALCRASYLCRYAWQMMLRQHLQAPVLFDLGNTTRSACMYAGEGFVSLQRAQLQLAVTSFRLDTGLVAEGMRCNTNNGASSIQSSSHSTSASSQQA